MMKYAINYDDLLIMEIPANASIDRFKGYDQAATLKEARKMIKDYWAFVKQSATMNMKIASKIKPI